MGDIQNYNMEHVDTLAPDTIKESVMCRSSTSCLAKASAVPARYSAWL